MHVDDAIRNRRTNMAVDPSRSVADDTIRELIALAIWAPNHKRTWPWRFASLTGDARRRLGESIADVMAARGEEPSRVDKARTKYLRTPNVLIVGSVAGDSDERTSENRDAVAAAVQNLLLAATARHINTYWGSCPKGAHEAVGRLAGFEPGTHVVAIIYLGHSAGAAEAPPRPTPSVEFLV